MSTSRISHYAVRVQAWVQDAKCVSIGTPSQEDFPPVSWEWIQIHEGEQTTGRVVLEYDKMNRLHVQV